MCYVCTVEVVPCLEAVHSPCTAEASSPIRILCFCIIHVYRRLHAVAVGVYHSRTAFLQLAQVEQCAVVESVHALLLACVCAVSVRTVVEDYCAVLVGTCSHALCAAFLEDRNRSVSLALRFHGLLRRMVVVCSAHEVVAVAEKLDRREFGIAFQCTLNLDLYRVLSIRLIFEIAGCELSGRQCAFGYLLFAIFAVFVAFAGCEAYRCKCDEAGIKKVSFHICFRLGFSILIFLCCLEADGYVCADAALLQRELLG